MRWKPRDPHVRRSREVKKRGGVLPEGRILTVMDIPNDRVKEALALSGNEGMLVDYLSKDRAEMEKDTARIRLPLEWGLKDILAKLESMPREAKNAVRGIVPTFKGYARRIRQC